jgi:hypothetical protein
VGLCLDANGRRDLVIRGSYGLFYDRVPLRALANALLSAGNTADPANLSQISISLSPAQSGAPVFPNIVSSLSLPPGVLFNFTTMNPQMENAYSEQISLEVERQLGRSMTASVGYQQCAGAAFDHLCEPERAGLHRGRQQQWLPAESQHCE